MNIFKDFWMRLFCIVFAVFLWYFVTNTKMRQLNVNVRISPASNQGVEVIPDNVKVKVEGDFNHLFMLVDSSVIIKGIPYLYFLRDDAENETVCEIRPESVSVPNGIRVVSVEPLSIKLKRIKK